MRTKILITGGSGFIGANLIELLLELKQFEILNVDKAKPAEEDHLSVWQKVDILDSKALKNVFAKFNPQLVVHLAARTDTNPDTKLNDYKSNTVGVQNVLDSIKACPDIERVVITSTQFVNQYNGFPKHDEDFAPHTVYGESKVITEKLTRTADLQCCWTIIRPTNIWGPRHPRYPSEFWYVLKKGRYIHPGKKPVIRSYGYVGNVVDQIMQILQKEPKMVHKQVLYVGDGPINLYAWANGFSLALKHKKIRVVPRLVVKSLALAGDIFRIFKIKFPISSSRYKSMTNSNSAPMDKTFEILGKPKYSLQQGIAETVEWLKEQDAFWKN